MTDLSPIQRAVMAKTLRQDPPPFDLRTGRVEELVTIEVDSRTEGLCLSNGNRVGVGKTLIQVYESQVQSVLDLVDEAKPAEIKAVHAHLDRHKEDVKKETGSPHHWVPAFASSYKAILGRDMKPLISAEVITPHKTGGE